MFTYAIDFASLNLLPEAILHEMGYGKVEPSGEVKQLVNDLLKEVAVIASPSCSFELFGGNLVEDAVELETGDCFRVGKTLASLLKKSTRYVLFTATSGSEFQIFLEETNRKAEILNSFILDMIGTCLVESVGDQLERLLEKEVSPERHTHRFSPGYCGWPLTDQKQLFALLGGSPCGISLSEVCLMMPVKSISGIIGVGQSVNEKAYGCQYCELETCYKRKRKKNEFFRSMD